MKQVLVISGSPRPKGNTYKIVKLVEEQVSALGNTAFEYTSLKSMHLEYCRGCLVCMKKGEEKCPCKDEAILLRDKMLAADGIIFCSPVYVHTVSALMKNFYDRFAYMCHQPRFRDKAAMFIVTTELTGGKEAIDYMRFPAFTWGFKMCSALDVVYPGFTNDGPYRKRILNRITEVAAEFHTALNTQNRKTLFSELMFFNLMKTKVTLHRDYLPQDYRYWKEKGWLDRNFYSSNDVPALKSFVAKKLVRLKVRRLLKSNDLLIENSLPNRVETAGMSDT